MIFGLALLNFVLMFIYEVRDKFKHIEKSIFNFIKEYIIGNDCNSCKNTMKFGKKSKLFSSTFPYITIERELQLSPDWPIKQDQRSTGQQGNDSVPHSINASKRHSIIKRFSRDNVVKNTDEITHF